MDVLRKFMPQRKDEGGKHSSWRKTCNTWMKMVNKFDLVSSLECKEWNPWKDWCKSWEEFQSSKEEPPKSEKQKAAMFAKLYLIAQLTRNRLETNKNDIERKANGNEALRNQNSILTQRCEELQRQLEVEKQRLVENDRFHRNNLEKEVHIRRTLEVHKEHLILQVDQKEEELQQVQAKNRDDRIHINNLEKEVELRRTLEVHKEYLTFQVDQKEEELQQVQAKNRELEEKLLSFQSQLVESSKNSRYQIIKNDIIVYPGNKLKPTVFPPQLENGEGEHKLDLDTIRYITDGLGQVSSSNVFDWLCSCEEEYKIWNWTVKDFEKILLRCMDSSSFASLPTMVKTIEISWLCRCKFIAETFVPGLNYFLFKEKMNEEDTVLQYFHRMWMIYRVAEFSHDLSKDDTTYKYAICEGLLPHLYEAGRQLRNEDYEDLESSLRALEYSLSESEKKRMKERKAGAGCPSRMKIWKRLTKYLVAFEKIDEAAFWVLLVELSRREDLETGAPIIYIKYGTP